MDNDSRQRREGRMKLNRDVLRKLPLAMRIEIEENAARKSLTQSELAFEQRRILAELRKHTAPGSRTDLKGGKATSGNMLPQVHTTSVVGKLYGESRTQVERRLAVMDSGNRKLIDQMDRDGRVSAAYRMLRCAEDEKRILGLRPIVGKFKTIVIDPPWKYESDFLGRAGPDYATMTQEELLALPVANWAEANAHLYLWSTYGMLPQAFALMDAWGFKYSSFLTWKKPSFVTGHNFRSQTEHILFGIRGRLKTRREDISNHFEAPMNRSVYSEKPEKFYEIVRAASYPPFGEAFQRKARPDFVNLYERVAEAAE
jgi:N6-adenosine-specific RNA methylase IME4